MDRKPKPDVAQYFEQLNGESLEVRMERVTGLCYDIMLNASKFVAGAALNNGIGFFKDYLPQMHEALMYLERFHRSAISGQGYGLALPKAEFRNFGLALCQLGVSLEYHSGVRDSSLMPLETIRSAGRSLKQLGSGIARLADEEYLYVQSIGAVIAEKKTVLARSGDIIQQLFTEALCLDAVRGYSVGLQQIQHLLV